MTTYESFKQDASTHRTIPIIQSFYTDTLTPIHMFHALKDEAVYMLESQDPESPWSNYSFIGLDPMVEIKEEDSSFTVMDFHKKKQQTAGSFKEAFNQVVDQLDVKIPDIALPFTGGGVGYISYDAISDYEPVPAAKTDDLNLSNYHLLFCQTLIAYHHRTKETTILSFARLDEHPSQEETFDAAKARIKAVQNRLMNQQGLTDLMLSEDVPDENDLELESNYEHNQFKEDVEK
ncbi:anthranilate synthase component I, partial [Halobacillus sp. BBL2006]